MLRRPVADPSQMIQRVLVVGFFSLLLAAAAATLMARSRAVERPAKPASAAPAVLRVSGSGSASKVLERLAPGWEAEHPEVRLRFLEGTDSGGGIAAVNDRAIELGAVSRAPKAGELTRGVEFRAFATDAAAFVAPDSGVTALSRQQLRRAFAGEVTNWRQLGGADRPIVVLVRDEGESLTQVLRRDLFGARFQFASDATVLSSTADMNEALTKTPGALGFSSYGSLVTDRLDLRPLAVGGRRPSVAALERHSYPFVRPWESSSAPRARVPRLSPT